LNSTGGIPLCGEAVIGAEIVVVMRNSFGANDAHTSNHYGQGR
jgi:hypothetical protein